MANGHDDRRSAEGEHAGAPGGREEFGGLKPGAAFFGWLVTVGVTVILTAIAGAIGFGAVDPAQVQGAAGTAGIVSAIVVLVLLGIAYFTGGYVAGRMARFNGLKQGVGVWVISIVVAILLAIIGAIAGAQYNVASQLRLPQLPVDAGSLTIGGLIALLVLLLVTLGAAMLGGKSGTQFHRKVDRAAGVR